MPEPVLPREAEVLIQKYVSGELTSEEAGRLLGHLKAQPSLGPALLGQMEVDILLRGLTGAVGRHGHPALSAISLFERALVPTEPAPPLVIVASRQRSWGIAWSGVLGLAAALALILGYWLWPDSDNAPRFAKGSPGVEVRRGAEKLSAARRFHLNAGDIVATGPGQTAVIEFAREGTRLKLGGETELRLLDWEKGKHFALSRGRLGAVVARQRAGEPMTVTTPEAEAGVRGTEFSLSSQWEATWLKVSKGTVDLRHRTTGLSQSVSAGQFVVAAQAAEFKLRPTVPGGLEAAVPVEPRVVSTGGDGEWSVGENFVRQSKVSSSPDPKPGGGVQPNPFSWFSREIPAKGSLEVSVQARMDAVVPGAGSTSFADFGFTLILNRKHLSFVCVRNPLGEGMVKLHSFLFGSPPAMEDGEYNDRDRAPLAPQPGQTFQLKARLTRLNPSQVQFQAKAWAQGGHEPTDWQLDAVRNAPVAKPLISLNTRRCACTFTDLRVMLLE